MFYRARLEYALRNPFVRLVAVLIALFLFGWLVYTLRAVLTPVFLSFLIAYLLDPVVDRFERRGINRTLAILILLVLLFIGASLMIFLIAWAVRDFIDVVKNDVPNWLDGQVLPWLNGAVVPTVSSWLDLDLNTDDNSSLVSGMVTEVRTHLTSLAPHLTSPVRAILSSALSGTVALVAWTANAILVPLFSFYLLRDFDIIVAKIRALLPRQFEKQIVQIFVEIDETIAAFVRGQLMVMLILGVLYGVGLTIAKVKLGFGIGLIAGLLCVIPYLGFFIGLGMALIMSLVGGENIWWNLIGTGLTFLIVQFLEGTVITPKVVGDKVGLHPVLVIVALLVGANLMGVFGMLIAVPTAAVLKLIINRGIAQYRKSDYFRRQCVEGTDTNDDLDDECDDEPGSDEDATLAMDSSDEDSVLLPADGDAPDHKTEEPEHRGSGTAAEPADGSKTEKAEKAEKAETSPAQESPKTLPHHPHPEVKKDRDDDEA